MTGSAKTKLWDQVRQVPQGVRSAGSGVARPVRLQMFPQDVVPKLLREEASMATVPGPDPDKPLPVPGAPGKELPDEEPERYEPAPRRQDEDEPEWAPGEWDPETEKEEEGAPAPL